MLLKLLCVLAHPDDESLALGGILARYASEGVETHVVTATRGELGWFGPPEENPGPEASAASGSASCTTLPPSSASATSPFSTTATASSTTLTRTNSCARSSPTSAASGPTSSSPSITTASTDIPTTSRPPAPPPRHWWPLPTRTSSSTPAIRPTPSRSSTTSPGARRSAMAYERAFGELRMRIDGHDRTAVTWPDWTISTWVDTSKYWRRVWDAIRCHRSQLPGYQKLLDLPDEYHQALWGQLTFHRVHSLVPAGNAEDDLFAGLRDRRTA